MTSILKVDTIQDTAGNNIINESGDTITIGASGDTITIPSGATTTLTDGVSGDFKMNSGYGSIATAYGCRAWVNFNGGGTVAIRESGNVSSITDNGTGDYTVNLTTAMTDINYCIQATANNDNNNASVALVAYQNITQNTVTSTRIQVRRCDTQALLDSTVVDVAIFR